VESFLWFKSGSRGRAWYTRPPLGGGRRTTPSSPRWYGLVRGSVPGLTWGNARSGTAWYGSCTRGRIRPWYMTCTREMSDTVDLVLLVSRQLALEDRQCCAELAVGEVPPRLVPVLGEDLRGALPPDGLVRPVLLEQAGESRRVVDVLQPVA